LGVGRRHSFWNCEIRARCGHYHSAAIN
jgi:hypothetical protein